MEPIKDSGNETVELKGEELEKVAGGGTGEASPGMVAYTVVCPACGQRYTFTRPWTSTTPKIAPVPPPHPFCPAKVRE